MGVFVRPSSKHGFRLIQETWTPKREAKAIPREGYSALGFHPNMTIEEAKLRAKQLNAQEKLEQQQIANAARRVDHKKKVNSAYLPQYLTESFELEIHETYRDNEDRLETILKHWLTAQKLIADLELDSKDFYKEKVKIVNYYKNKKWSPDYIKRITRMLNLWGGFASRKNSLFFQPLPKLSNIQTQKIVELREDLTTVRKPAPPLKWSDLSNKKTSFEHGDLLHQWNWLYIALWFGLRPSEVDNLTKKGHYEIKYSDDHQIDIISVYQTKLTS